MKKQSINYSWPVILSDFSQDSVNENFSRAKLWVYYKGQTADKRYFSDEFAEQIKKTLPYTPVVSYYDEEKEDFVGHASQQQIYGIVDPCVEPVFTVREEDGKTWCLAEIVLYTERPDKTGEIAKKIVGQPHSLELNPQTIKYTINYDEKKHFKNIEFTAGDFIGVSVLGKDQKPAFSGSAFFEANEEFENKIKMLYDYCKNNKDDLKTNGGENMNLEEFMKLSWGDVSAKVERAICREYENDAYTYVVDMFDDSAIVRFYYYVGGDCKLMRVNYSCSENGEVSLGTINEIRVVYEDVVEVSPVAEIDMTQVEDNTTGAVSDCTIESVVETTNTDNKDDILINENSEEFAGQNIEDLKDPIQKTESEENLNVEDTDSFTSQDTISDPAQVTDVEITPTISEVSVENEQQTIQKTSTTSTTSFTDSEREELETLKREKKIGLVNSYKESLTIEQLNDFMQNINDFSIKDLELELLKIYKVAQENIEHDRPIRAFAFAPINAKQEKDSPLDAFVRKNRRN